MSRQRSQRLLQRAHRHQLHPLGQLPGAEQFRSRLGVRDQEQGDAGPASRHRFLLDATNGTDPAVGTDGSGRRHLRASGQISAGEQIDHPEGEGQAGRRSAHLAAVDGHVSVVADEEGIAHTDPQQTPGGIHVANAQHHLHLAGGGFQRFPFVSLAVAPRGGHHPQNHPLPRPHQAYLFHQRLGIGDIGSVHGHHDIAELQHPVGGRTLQDLADLSPNRAGQTQPVQGDLHRYVLGTFHEHLVGGPAVLG